MSSDAFSSLRVTEALRAIKSYLDIAAQLAGGIPPADVVTLPTTPGTPGLSPRLTRVIWDKSGTRKISLPDSSTVNGVTRLDLIVTGQQLDDPETLKLVGVGPGAPFFETDDFSNLDPNGLGFTATVDITEPSEGTYDVKFVNEHGQTFVLSRACRIKANPGGYATARKALPSAKSAGAKKTAAARKRAVAPVKGVTPSP